MSVIVEGRINGIDVCGSIQKITAAGAKAVKDAGFEFVYIQSSRYSSTPELSFAKTLDLFRNAGLSCGAYHFCSHDSDPVRQAEFFYKASGGLGSKPGELPPMVDWEYCTPSRYQNHPQHCVDWLTSHIQAVDKLWYPDNADRILQRHPVVYTYPNYSGTHQPALAKAGLLSGYPLCYASYKSEPLPNGGWQLVPWLPLVSQGPLHAIPEPWQRWTLWQYSGDRGLTVPGIAGYCDRQVFNGTSGDWSVFLGMARVHNETSFGVKDDFAERKTK